MPNKKINLFFELKKLIKEEGFLFVIYIILARIFIAIPILIISFILSIVFLPFFHIPKGKKLTFKLEIKIVNSNLTPTIRPMAEAYLKNFPLLFSTTDKDSNTPTYLYMNQKDIDKLPKELISFKHYEDINQTVRVTVKTRKNILGTYLPAKLINFEILNKKPKVEKYNK